jgi:NADPH-dependent 2,4-dienoyl-CoA reductase/sulfur reductase-like enzyme
VTVRADTLCFEAVVIGAGPAGLAAAVSLKQAGIRKVLVVEREQEPGGILLQCIHNGFGLHRFSEELTGPEYAERYIELAGEAEIEFLYNAIVLDIMPEEGGHRLAVLCEGRGLLQIEAGAVILAMGCRERTRGNINIPGSRPAGVMTAGLAQKLVNILGYLPGKETVILGSGDIGLIMARRLTWEGVRVKAVVEVQPFPGGLSRNIVQCLNDFNIPLYLSHTVSRIYGNHRIEAVEISPIDGHLEPREKGRFLLTCDTLLLSVGLIPENELSARAGVALHPVTRGPLVDGNLMTSVPGLFACGNVLHVHDLVDWVSEEAETAGINAARYLRGELAAGRQVSVRAGNLVRYVLPSRLTPGDGATVSLRPITPAENVMLSVRAGDRVLFRRKYRRIMPSSMLRIKLKELPEEIESLEVGFTPSPAAGPEEEA